MKALFMNKYLWVAIGVAFLALAAVAHHNHAVSRAEDRGYSRGLKDERLVWQVRENHELNAANAEITRLQNEYRALEQKSIKDLAALSAVFQRDLENVQADRDRFVAGVRSGAIRLRIPGTTTCPQSPGGSQAASPGAGAAGSNEAPRAELPPEIAEALYALASEADEVVLQLRAAQGVIVKDREVCK